MNQLMQRLLPGYCFSTMSCTAVMSVSYTRESLVTIVDTRATSWLVQLLTLEQLHTELFGWSTIPLSSCKTRGPACRYKSTALLGVNISLFFAKKIFTVCFYPCSIWIIGFHLDGLVQERRNSSALTMELCLSCIYPSIYLSNRLSQTSWTYCSVASLNNVTGGGSTRHLLSHDSVGVE